MLTVGRRGRPPPRLKDPVEVIRSDSPVLVGANVATSSNGVPGFHGVDATGPLAGDATTKGSFWPPATTVQRVLFTARRGTDRESRTPCPR